MAQPKTKTYVAVRINTELLAAIDELTEKGVTTRTDLIEEGLRLVLATRRGRKAIKAKKQAE